MIMPRVSDMKKRLLEAAMDLMWENSYSAASVDATSTRPESRLAAVTAVAAENVPSAISVTALPRAPGNLLLAPPASNSSKLSYA